MTTAHAAHSSLPGLAIGNGLGSIAVQTAFLAVADFAYRQGNLEHAAASVANLLNAFLLIVILAVVLLATMTTDMAIGHISPMSIAIFAIYMFGLKLAQNTIHSPMWRPVRNEVTKAENQEKYGRASQNRTSRLIGHFIAHGTVLVASGFLLSHIGGSLSERFGLPDTLVGASVTGLITSLPELVTTVAAVRQGALVLAVSNIVGGNTFDSLFVAVGDLFYIPGPIYRGATVQDQFLMGLSILLTAVLGAGLVVRQRRDWSGIGFESIAMLVIYGLGMTMMFLL